MPSSPVDQKGNRSDLFDGSISISLCLELSEEQVQQIQQNVKEWLGADLIHFSLSRVCGCEAELRLCLDAQNDSAHSDAAETLAIVSQVLKHSVPCGVTGVKRTAMTSSSGPRQAQPFEKTHLSLLNSHQISEFRIISLLARICQCLHHRLE